MKMLDLPSGQFFFDDRGFSNGEDEATSTPTSQRRKIIGPPEHPFVSLSRGHLHVTFPFLGSGPDKGRSPVDWGEIPFIHLSVRTSIPPVGLLRPLWQALRPLWQALRALWQALRPLGQAPKPI